VTQPSSKPGNPGEFTTFMRNHQDMVFSTAARLTGDPAQAEDIAQQVFMKAWEDFGRLRASDAAGGWLRTVALHLTLNHLSRYRRRWRFFSEMATPEQDPWEQEIPAPGSLLDGLDDDARHVRVEQAIRSLPDHQRVPLVLYHFEALSYRQIADHLRISLPKVKTDILRARAALTRSLMQP
jgi:RNA polymerase sigma-70 factor (ECF subfamily)